MSEPTQEQATLRVGFGERKASDKYLKFLLKQQYREESMTLFKGTQKIVEIPEGERGDSKNQSYRSTLKTPLKNKLRQSMVGL